MRCRQVEHAHVLLAGRCVACGLPVQASGPLAGELVWLAVPFGEHAATCRITDQAHDVDHAVGSCSSCSTRVEGVVDRGEWRWFGW